MVDLDDISVLTEPSKEYLNQRQELDYKSERESCLKWLLTFGKNPEKADGYAHGTVKPRSSRIDQFYRFVWEYEGGYTANVTHEHADAWMTHLAQRDVSNTHKCNCQKAIKMLFKWRKHEHGFSEWDPKITFSQDSSSNPREFLTRDERAAVRDAALEYGSVPAYNNLTPAERDRWKAYLAQRFDKPKEDVEPSDWDRANGWKVPSLVWASLDAGLRPIEVERSKISWIDTDNSVLRIPKSESSKNRDNWVVSLRERTAQALKKWLDEREAYAKYEDTDAVWLTRQGNPYDTSSLRYLLKNLCEIADIDTQHRQMSWYAIRHSVGTYMTREEDLAAAQAQLRHKNPETTMKYDQVPIEDRQDALDRMG
ncbi:site-specific integrase [Halobacterium sp. KA-4]|uniref:tyrosine-type recombinase/integrase n=1 Tax=Halobacterium TaxID=2239 RepID=UPI001E43537F|nr:MULTISPECIES: site-specific integrase [Halobacterium]MCD2199535.1 site-specific integrase [Halobacterium sp. KA-4]MDL0126836.1 site-specific integrase [Halobacterium salinarum]MDL0134207.1 site-specific integrase [Halobacterium salinarum]